MDSKTRANQSAVLDMLAGVRRASAAVDSVTEAPRGHEVSTEIDPRDGCTMVHWACECGRTGTVNEWFADRAVRHHWAEVAGLVGTGPVFGG